MKVLRVVERQHRRLVCRVRGHLPTVPTNGRIVAYIACRRCGAFVSQLPGGYTATWRWFQK